LKRVSSFIFWTAASSTISIGEIGYIRIASSRALGTGPVLCKFRLFFSYRLSLEFISCFLLLISIFFSYIISVSIESSFLSLSSLSTDFEGASRENWLSECLVTGTTWGVPLIGRCHFCYVFVGATNVLITLIFNIQVLVDNGGLWSCIYTLFVFSCFTWVLSRMDNAGYSLIMVYAFSLSMDWTSNEADLCLSMSVSYDVRLKSNFFTSFLCFGRSLSTSISILNIFCCSGISPGSLVFVFVVYFLYGMWLADSG
jgi:hypothetical protein